MTTVRPGWYPDQNDPNAEVYWDGARWHGRRARVTDGASTDSRLTDLSSYSEKWAELSNTARNMVVGGVLAAFALVLVVVALLLIRPWESETYKNCKESAAAYGLDSDAPIVQHCVDTLSPYAEN